MRVLAARNLEGEIMSPLHQAFMLTSAALIIGIGIVGVLAHQRAPRPVTVTWKTSGYGLN